MGPESWPCHSKGVGPEKVTLSLLVLISEMGIIIIRSLHRAVPRGLHKHR